MLFWVRNIDPANNNQKTCCFDCEHSYQTLKHCLFTWLSSYRGKPKNIFSCKGYRILLYEIACRSADGTGFLQNNFCGTSAGPAYNVYHPQKGITICVFLTYLGADFKNNQTIKQFLFGPIMGR